jgi:hypothetical protein
MARDPDAVSRSAAVCLIALPLLHAPLPVQTAVRVDFTDVAFELPTVLYGSADPCPIQAHVSELSIDIRDPGPYMVCRTPMTRVASVTQPRLLNAAHLPMHLDRRHQRAADSHIPDHHQGRPPVSKHAR